MIFSSKQVAKQLGISYWAFRGRIEKYGMTPHLLVGGVHFWDEPQVDVMREMLIKENNNGGTKSKNARGYYV